MIDEQPRNGRVCDDGPATDLHGDTLPAVDYKIAIRSSAAQKISYLLRLHNLSRRFSRRRRWTTARKAAPPPPPPSRSIRPARCRPPTWKRAIRTVQLLYRAPITARRSSRCRTSTPRKRSARRRPPTAAKAPTTAATNNRSRSFRASCATATFFTSVSFCC